MGRIYKRGGTYYADLRAEGGGRVSLHTSDRKVAKARLQQAQLGETLAGPNPYPLELALDDWLATCRTAGTLASYQSKARRLIDVLGAERDVNTLTRAEVVAYAKQRKGEGLSDHTIAKHLTALRGALKEGLKRGTYRGGLDVVPQWAAHYEPRTRYLTADDLRVLLDAAPEHRRMWIVLQVYTSANLSEVRRMTWEHIDLREGWARVPGTKKSKRWRRVPIHRDLRRWLMAADRSQPLVAPWPSVTHELPELAQAAGIGHVTTNDLRRTFAAWLKQQGVDSLPVAHMMGHSSTIMVERVYGQLSDETYRAAIERLPDAKKRGR